MKPHTIRITEHKGVVVREIAADTVEEALTLANAYAASDQFIASVDARLSLARAYPFNWKLEK